MPKNTLLKEDQSFDGLPPWMAAMRKAVTDCVSESDIKEIVQNQVKRAKDGDKDAIKFVFGQILGSDSFKGATFVQNNNYGGDPAKPAKTKPGSVDRIEQMRLRAEAGVPLHQDGDATLAEGE
jgi:hypothetical protein